jgi:hypothetical protein
METSPDAFVDTDRSVSIRIVKDVIFGSVRFIFLLFNEQVKKHHATGCRNGFKSL